MFLLNDKSLRSCAAALIIFLLSGPQCPGEEKASFHYNSHGRRDPFVPLVGVAREGSAGGVLGVFSIDDVVLQGITLGPEGERFAVLNGEIMKQGDKAGNLTVESISENKVRLRIKDRVYEKELYKTR